MSLRRRESSLLFPGLVSGDERTDEEALTLPLAGTLAWTAVSLALLAGTVAVAEAVVAVLLLSAAVEAAAASMGAAVGVGGAAVGRAEEELSGVGTRRMILRATVVSPRVLLLMVVAWGNREGADNKEHTMRKLRMTHTWQKFETTACQTVRPFLLACLCLGSCV